MEQSSDGMPVSQRRANSQTEHSSKSDEVAQDMLQSDIPHETVSHCQNAESEEIDSWLLALQAHLEKQKEPPHKKIDHSFKENSSSKNKRWSSEEDEALTQMVNKHGTKNWQIIACAIPGRNAHSCFSRWTRSLDPAINKEDWSEQEDLKLIRAHQIYGSQWLKMVKHFPGRTNHALKEHWRGRMKGKLNFYLASGLLEQVPDLEEDISVPESSQSDIPKDSQGSSDRSPPLSVSQTMPKSKQELPELDENAGTSEVSDKVLAKSKQRARARRKLDFLSTPVELKVCTAAASCQRPRPKLDQTSPVDENISPSDVCQNISQNVASEHVDAVIPLAANNHHPNDFHSPATADPFSLEMHEANASDLLDMSYCDGLIIDSPRYPHDSSFI